MYTPLTQRHDLSLSWFGTHRHDLSLSWLGTRISIKQLSAGVTLFLLPPPLPITTIYIKL
jgi:hypothetical protein